VKHADVRTHMAGYLEGDLPIAERALFDAHLDDCEICALEIAEMRATISLLRSLPEPEVPADLANQVLRRIRAGDGRQTWLDHVRAGFEFLTAPRILAPISATMVAVGVLMATGQMPLFMPSDSSLGGTEVSIAMPSSIPGPASSSSSAARQRLAATGSATAERRIGASAADESSAEQLADTSSITQRRRGVTVRSRGRAADSQAERMGPSRGVTREIAPFVALHESTPVSLARSPRAMQASSQPRAGSPNAAVSVRPQSEMLEAMVGPRWVSGDPATPGSMPSSDEWIARATRNPAHFAEILADRTLAESELWVDNLARHAVAQGKLDAFIQVLRNSSSAQARLLADDFEAAGRRAVAEERGDSSGGP
jgi:hypothetical protein